MPGGANRPADALVIHDDGELLDRLTRVFEARGLAVRIAPSGARALAELRGHDYDVVVAGWRVAQGAGLDVYRGALAARPELRGRFVFLAADVPDDFQDVVEGRCLLLHPGELEEILRVVEATVVRARELEQARLSTFDLNWVSDDQPTMLLVDDEPVELMYMVRAFADLGFAVTPAESGNAALAQLEHGDFDVIVSDWFMVDGSGADLYAWVVAHRPGLVARVVFISGAPPRDFESRAPGRVLIPKGQDSAELVKTVVGIARRARAGSRSPG